MALSTSHPCGPLVFHPSSRRRHRRYYPSDSDTDSTYSSSSSDDSAYHISYPHRHRRRRWHWPRSVLGYPTWGGGLIAGPAAPGLVTAATVIPQQLQTQTQPQPRRYGYRRFHYQGGERARRGCGRGQGQGHHHHHQHHHRRVRSPRRCILPRFGRWLIGDPPEPRRWCDHHGGGCCDEGCGAEVTPTMHHEDEYWGPGDHPSEPWQAHADELETTAQRNGTIPSWAYGPDGTRHPPWRYGGPTNTTNGGNPELGPGGTIEEVEEGGTAPALPNTTTTAAAVPVPVPVAATAAGMLPASPYEASHTHYHLDNDNDGDGRGRSSRRRRYGHSHSRHDGVLGLVEQERRRDSGRHVADVDASRRREAALMGLVDRERDRGGGHRAGLDILGLVEGELERRLREERRDDVARRDTGGWEGAFDALSRRVDQMVLLGREGGSSETGRERGRGEEKRKNSIGASSSVGKRAPVVKFTKDSNSDGPVDSSNNASTGPRSSEGVAAGGNIIFSREGGGSADGDEDADSDETSGASSAAAGRGVRRRGRALRRAGSPSASVD
ncbi:hypothetical protein N8I77_010689 [Diaporthe amygdali]|uniref:Uncharacterized protein n=1 Tax=Phomopsis amygdali TaxID=1214568 RepID=A0AAD9VZL9_PHOAM|nr:hypothetical protein N8I77_010689 [Diaporthe amygdali]